MKFLLTTILRCGLGLSALLALTVWAAAPEATILIGGQNKTTIGTVVGATQGDIACYLTLKDDAGKEFQEPAAFDLCDDKWKGQRVQLEYRMANVLATSCQGNPDCKKTDRIALVTRLTSLGKAASATGTSPSQKSFCTPQESVIFTCATGSKLVSVCASRTITAKSGYLQYRFGTPGQPLEITLPEGEVHPLKAAHGQYEPYAGGGMSWLRFKRGGYSYTVYGGAGRWGAKGETVVKQGLAVANNGKTIANLKCNGRNEGELGPQWFEQTGYRRNDKEEFYAPD
jgi:hypothetical protein